MITLAMNQAVSMFKNETPIAVDEIKTTLTEIFIELGNEKPNIMPIKAYVERNKNCTIGISHSDNHAIPMFNHVAITALKCEFTAKLKARGIAFIELSNQHQKALRELHSSTCNTAKNELKHIASFATLAIGTVGSRLTNRDMSYEIHIDNLPTHIILDALKPYNLINQNRANVDRTTGYVMTCRNDVERFMSLLGMSDDYLNAVIHVESHQERNKLKNQYDGQRINDKSKTLIYKLKLAA